MEETSSVDQHNVIDRVRAQWQDRRLASVDAEPEAGTGAPGNQVTLTARAKDQFGADYTAVNTVVNFELFAGSAHDADGNTPGTVAAPEGTCNTVDGSLGDDRAACQFNVTAGSPGTDLFCVWVGTAPAMEGTAPSGTCADEGRDASTAGPVDVISLTWGAGGGGRRLGVYSEFQPYGGFDRGAWVATGNVAGDGREEVVTGASEGGGPHVRVLSIDKDNGQASEVASFMAFGPSFGGGVRVAVGELDAGSPGEEIVVAAGPGGGPHVRIWGGDGSMLSNGFFVYGETFTGGVFTAVGNVDGAGLAEIVTGAGPGGGPHVRVWRGDGSLQNDGFMAYAVNFGGGVRVAAGDTDNDLFAEIVTASGPGQATQVRCFRA
jgi:hypothetical protein